MSQADIMTAVPPPDAAGKVPPKERALNMFRILMGNCFCEPLMPFDVAAASTQFVELHGILFIGLGAMSDELSPKDRVYDTLEQLRSRTERMVSIGYLVEDDEATLSTVETDIRKITQTIPLDVWNKSYPNDQNMSRPVKKLVDLLKMKEFRAMMIELSVQLTSQKAHLNRGNNKYLAGITAHNLAVVQVLAGETQGVIELFQEAISLKEAAFGSHHFEVALSWDELGIQLFANSRFEEALEAFRAAKMVRSKSETTHLSLSMCLNNIAACDFQMKNHQAAFMSLKEALAIQQNSVGSSAKGDLDLLQTATVMSNFGYLNLCLRMYDEARTLFEEALLIQQSVLDDNHRAVRDTLSNLSLSNAFHM
uniref:MalT-like TPR region domain-containing protein n=1 Tax=Amphora coffeiformis TaxID=265554 RepID=A0A6S8JIB4_9STRA|mmetsp:Transcript_17874/g.33967  ORF Transcript_17874/g.33967 Transcript_17874/m.33967 type:complete len:366 (+) Transcript_17874:136-1233(+)